MEEGLKHIIRCTLRIPSWWCLCELATSLGKFTKDLWHVQHEDLGRIYNNYVCFFLFLGLYIFSFSNIRRKKQKSCSKTNHQPSIICCSSITIWVKALVWSGTQEDSSWASGKKNHALCYYSLKKNLSKKTLV
jgi:hypothetical protein